MGSDAVTSGEAPHRPVLRYHGGKWMLAPWVIAHFPPHDVYVEPFAGAASVLMRKPRSRAEVLNDLDGDVVHLFRMIRERPKELARALFWTPFSREEFDRAQDGRGEEVDDVERARRLVLRSFMGFGSTALLSGGRTGRRAKPIRGSQTGAIDWSNYPPTIRRFAARLRGVILENRPALRVIEDQDGKDTLFYVDPPYVSSSRTAIIENSHRGYRHEMTDRDHEELIEALRRVRGMVVLSGYWSELYGRTIPGDWVAAKREHLANGAVPRTEFLWLNPAARRNLNRMVGLPLFRDEDPANLEDVKGTFGPGLFRAERPE